MDTEEQLQCVQGMCYVYFPIKGGLLYVYAEEKGKQL